jgi:hypothetical protein
MLAMRHTERNTIQNIQTLLIHPDEPVEGKVIAMIMLSCIQWDPKFSVHHEAFDAGHRELFDIVNRRSATWSSIRPVISI